MNVKTFAAAVALLAPLPFLSVAPAMAAAPTDSYLLTVSSSSSVEEVAKLVEAVGGTTTNELSAAGVVQADLTATQRARLDATAAVKDTSNSSDRVELAGTDAAATRTTNNLVGSAGAWGLDRIDQATGLNNAFTYTSQGAGVDVYVVDTGVRSTHVQFGSRVKAGFDATTAGTTEDCQGHGTHVAGTVAGNTVGVAPKANIIPIRVFPCSGSGTVDDIVEGVDWAIDNHQAGTPAVMNLSLTSGVNAAVDAAVQAAKDDGIVVVAAAGNYNASACNYSPAHYSPIITVGGTDATDNLWKLSDISASNSGPCVDIFAPGGDVLSSYKDANDSYAFLTGTSMAAPHVAGVAAMMLAKHPSWTPDQVAAAMDAQSAVDVVKADTVPLNGAPNRFLQSSEATPVINSLSASQQANTGKVILELNSNHFAPDGTVSFFVPELNETFGPFNATSSSTFNLTLPARATEGTYTFKATYTAADGSTVSSPSGTSTTLYVVPIATPHSGNIVGSVAPAGFSAAYQGSIKDKFTLNFDTTQDASLPNVVYGVNVSLFDAATSTLGASVATDDSVLPGDTLDLSTLTAGSYWVDLIRADDDHVAQAGHAISIVHATVPTPPVTTPVPPVNTPAPPVSNPAPPVSNPTPPGGGGGGSVVVPPVDTPKAPVQKPTPISAILGGENTLSMGVSRELSEITGKSFTRTAGTDRYETSARISEQAFPAGAKRVYVALGSNFPDALAAAAAAGATSAPVLLVEGTQIPSAVKAELTRLNPEEVILVGSQNALATSVSNSVNGLLPKASVKRIGGLDRYETAALLTLDAHKSADTVYLATGANFPDALSAASAASLTNSALLLVPGDSIPASVSAAIAKLNPSKIVVLGGTSSISEATVQSAGKIVSVQPTRLSGADRYETAALTLSSLGKTYDNIFFATGNNFPDALSGAAAATANGVPLFIVSPNGLDTMSRNALVGAIRK